ncbi:MAG: hypothetical protein QW808_01650, partial [Desulfurococcaceae archaeon]
MRGQAEAVGAIVISALILLGLVAYSLVTRSASRQLQEASEIAQLDAARRAEQLYFYYSNGAIYARSTVGSRVLYIASYNEDGVIYEGRESLFVALNWTQLVADRSTAEAVKSGRAHLVAVTSLGNVFTWDPYGGVAQLLDHLRDSLSRPRVAVLPVGFKMFVGSSASADALVSGPSIYPYAQFGANNVDIFATSTGVPYCAFSALTYNRSSGSLSGCGKTVSYAVQNDSVTIVSGGGYAQVYRVVRASGADIVSLSAHFSVSSSASVSFVPVVYVYDASYDISSPVTTYNSVGAYTGGATILYHAENYRPSSWLARVKLEEGPVS